MCVYTDVIHVLYILHILIYYLLCTDSDIPQRKRKRKLRRFCQQRRLEIYYAVQFRGTFQKYKFYIIKFYIIKYCTNCIINKLYYYFIYCCFIYNS